MHNYAQIHSHWHIRDKVPGLDEAKKTEYRI
jgi:hypothetical protein